MRFLSAHEQYLCIGALEQLAAPLHARGVHVVLRVAENSGTVFDEKAELIHLANNSLVHLGSVHPIRTKVTDIKESGQGLLTNSVLSGLNGQSDHRYMQCRRRADVDNINTLVSK